MTMNLEQYREWLKQELVDSKNILDEAQWLILKAEQGINFYTKALVLLEEVKEEDEIQKSKVKIEEPVMTASTTAPTEKTPSTSTNLNSEFQILNSDRTPAQMIASKYKEYSIPTAIEVYLNTLNGGSATVDEIEMELFDLQDGDSDVERKKVRATLSTVLSTGMSKKKFTKVSKGNWSLYKATDVDGIVDGVIVDERGDRFGSPQRETPGNVDLSPKPFLGDIPVVNTTADVENFTAEENSSFLEEDLLATSNSKHY